MDNTPVYLQIKAHLDMLIRMNHRAPAYRLPSESQLAEQFGVSHPTVRRAFALLEAENKIYRLQGKGAFIRQAETVASAGRYRVCITVPTLNDHFARQLLEGAGRYLREQRIDTYIQCIGDDYREEERSIYTVIRQEFHGLLIFPGYQTLHNKAYTKLAMSQYPLVEMVRHRKGMRIGAVYCDHFQQTYTAARFLHQKGHIRIVLFTEPGESSATYAERIRGYESYVRSALDASAIRVMETKTFSDQPYDSQEDMATLFRRYKDLTAVILPARFVHHLVLYLTHKLLPQPDILVLDDMDEDVRQLLPVDLYILSQQPEEIGRLAARQLHGLISGNEEPHEEVVPSHIRYSPRPER